LDLVGQLWNSGGCCIDQSWLASSSRNMAGFECMELASVRSPGSSSDVLLYNLFGLGAEQNTISQRHGKGLQLPDQ
jgi:hypothetical protein